MFLPSRQVHRRLAADRGVHLGEQRRRQLHAADAAQEAAGDEPAEVADAAAAEGEQPAVALAAGVEHALHEPLGGSASGLRRLPLRHLQTTQRPAAAGEQRSQSAPWSGQDRAAW